MTHNPNYDIKDDFTQHLAGKKIALLVTGSIAAKKVDSYARHFIHYGADVAVYLSEAALDFATIQPLEASTGKDVITELSGKGIEHLNEYQAYVLLPGTGNTISKIANGIADNAVTSAAFAGLGYVKRGESKFLVAPAMHGVMWDNPALEKNIETLESYGVKIIKPVLKDDRADLEDTHPVIVETIRELSNDPLDGKYIFINAGSPIAKIDDVRGIGNIFRGRLGLMIAEEAYMRGAEVKLIYGDSGGLDVPKYIDTTKVKYFEGMYNAVMKEIENREWDAGIFSAAIPDYKPKDVVEGKIKSQGSLQIKTEKTPKIITEVRQKCPDLYMTTFKLESNISHRDLKEIGKQRLQDGYQIVVANILEDMSIDDHNLNPALIMESNGTITEANTKRETANYVLDIIGRNL